MFSAVATSVTERPALKSFTGLISFEPRLRFPPHVVILSLRLCDALALTLKHHSAFELAKPEKIVSG
jgi:hypothetical protein